MFSAACAMFSSVQTMSTSSTAGSSETTATSTSVSIKQEVVERESPPLSALSGGVGGEAAVVAATAAAAAATVQHHFRLGRASSPSTAGTVRRSTLGYMAATAGPRAARMHSTTQPETCVCEVSECSRSSNISGCNSLHGCAVRFQFVIRQRLQNMRVIVKLFYAAVRNTQRLR